MKSTWRINCRKANRLLHERLSGTLPPEKGVRLDEHLARCAACAQRARNLEEVIGLLHRTPAPTPPAALGARIHAAVRQNRPAEAATLWRRRPAPALAAAALVAVAVLAVVLWPRATRLPISEPTGETVMARETAPAALTAPISPTTPTPEASPARESRPRMVSVRRTWRSPRPEIVPAITRGPQPEPISPQVARAPVAMSADNMVAGTTRAAGPRGLAQAEYRIAKVAVDSAEIPAPAPAAASDAFADEIVGGLIANVMLTSYLDGAPAGLEVQPAVLEHREEG